LRAAQNQVYADAIGGGAGLDDDQGYRIFTRR
jgi:hypothetical protein